MEERGVIARCGAELDAEAVGRALHVMITFKFNPDAQFSGTPNATLAPLLENSREVIRFWEIYGELDFLIEAALQLEGRDARFPRIAARLRLRPLASDSRGSASSASAPRRARSSGDLRRGAQCTKSDRFSRRAPSHQAAQKQPQRAEYDGEEGDHNAERRQPAHTREI